MVPINAVAALFMASGAASLLYQVVWMRMLIRVFGVTTLAVSTVVAAFMGGLALGSHFGGLRSRQGGAGLKLYARLELAAAAAACLATLLMTFLPNIYAHLASEGTAPSARTATRLLLAALVLLPPTTLMGATLPILTRFVADREKKAGLGLAVLYGFNTLGAVIGVLFSGYVALALFGERSTVGLALVINLLCGLGALNLSRQAGEKDATKTATPSQPLKGGHFYLALFVVSGFCALGLEVLWSRLMILLVGSSVYAFSALLAVNLLGIGVGSLLCAVWLRRGLTKAKAPQAFGLLQAGIGAAVLVGLACYRWSGMSATQFKYLYSPLERPSDVLAFFKDCILVVLPPALLMGLSFPLAGPLLAENSGDEGAAAGRAFAVNTIGGVLGSLAAGFILVPVLGTALSCLILAGASVFAGAAALIRSRAGRKSWGAFTALAAVALIAGYWTGDPARDILAHRVEAAHGTTTFHWEQTAATVTGVEHDGVRTLLLNGIAVSGNGLPGRAMALVPLMLRPDSHRMLVICFGAGNTFRAALRAGLTVDAVDLVAGVFKAFSWFYPDGPEIMARPEGHTFVDDGRHFLLASKGGYDEVVVDGSPPIYAAATVNLYTREFLDLAHSRLNRGGVMTLWVPIPCRVDDLGAIARNFTDVFPHVAYWYTPGFGGVILMGSDLPIVADQKAIEKSFKDFRVAAELPGLSSRFVVEGMPFEEMKLRRIAALFAPLTDDRPRTEFPLGPLLSGDRFMPNNVVLTKAFASLDPGVAP
ncbi:MAG: fused MFS/spermidine synthase [Elusimicrobiota bacterium]